MNEEELFINNRGLIFLAIKNMHLYWKTNDEFQDYIDAGTDGLLIGIRTYDKTKGTKESTYYYACIKNEINKMLIKKNLKRYKGQTISLNLLANEIDDTELIDLIPGDIDIEKEIEDKLMAERIVEIIDTLPIVKDRYVIKMYYGLDGYERMNCTQIAKRWGVNKNRIIDRKERAINKLRRRMKQEGIWK